MLVTSKTISYAIVHFSVTFFIVWLLTGDVLIGSIVAMVEPAVNTVAYFFHEKIWHNIISKKGVNGAQLLLRK
jgi:uncharacterized membrane protein